MTDTITITGNVATPPELRRIANGTPVTSFRVASGQRKFDRATGAWVDSGTNWYTVSAWRSLGDHVFHSLRKGDRVVLTGRLRQRDWENGEKNGTSIEIDVDAIGHDLLWGTTAFTKDERSTGSSADQAGPAAPPESPAEAWAAPGVEDDPAAGWPTAAVPASGAEETADAPF